MTKFLSRYSFLVLSAFIVLSPQLATANNSLSCSALFSGDLAVVQAPVAQGPVEQQVEKKSGFAQKPLLSRVFSNINRFYFKADPRAKKDQGYDYLDDYDFIREKRVQDKLGLVRSFFSNKFDTRIYYSATGAPDASGHIPVVNPKSKALFVYIHGSGTSKGGGANFSYKMNKLAPLGYSTLSFDLPYHSEGSRSRDMLNADKFYAMMRDMIKEYRVPGMPVYLAGHSFGPDVIAEFAKRYPFDVDGVVMISPGSFNKVMEDWFKNHTSKMAALWGDTITNDDGGAWAGKVSSQHKWRKPPTASSPDPTVVNPNLKIRILSGSWEEYVPGQLDARGLPTKTDRDYDVCKALHELLSKAVCNIEPGVGHYIFEHKDAQGYDVILRELLAIDGQTLDNEKQLKEEAINNNKLTDTQELARKFAREPSFRQYIVENFAGKETVQQILTADDQKQARKILNDFGRYVVTQRDRALIENIKSTQNWNPTFYGDNKADIDALEGPKARPTDSFLNKYFSMIEQLPPEERAAHAHAPTDVYKVPEPKAPPIDLQERRERKNKDKEAPAAAAVHIEEKAG